jgi:hypothetical protein
MNLGRISIYEDPPGWFIATCFAVSSIEGVGRSASAAVADLKETIRDVFDELAGTPLDRLTDDAIALLGQLRAAVDKDGTP